MTVFIQKGDAPMSLRQGVKRGLRYFEAEKQQYVREQGLVQDDPDYKAWAAQWILDNETNAANNEFNYALFGYNAAIDRLSKYRLAEGRESYTIETPSGVFDEEGNEIMDETVVPEIPPLDPTVDQPVYDDEGNQTGTEVVDNPLIVADDAERDQAQLVIDNTPEEVQDFEV